MIHTHDDQATDFTAANRDEIREHLTAAIGDDQLPEDVRETLVRDLEDRDNVSADEFWTVVEAAFTAHGA